MSGKVILEVIKGVRQGQKYEFEGAERLFVGRQEDCAVVMPEETVSRYHCMLDIQPPCVKLQDFGSLNGTYLNDQKIGQRERTQSWEAAKDEPHETFDLKSGDILRLGKSCEIRCLIEEAECCPICGAELPKLQGSGETAPEDAERLVASFAGKLYTPARNTQKKCQGCGKMFTPKASDNNLCSSCLNDRGQLLDGIFAELVKDNAQQEQLTPSFLEGYDKVCLLGKGGMGEVWKVKERRTGKCYALKTMLPQVAASENSKKLFLREAGVCESLKHKNVVRAYKTGCANGVFYILMDLCEGGSVDSLMVELGGKLPLELATYIILQALSGLDYVHNMDIDVEIKTNLSKENRKVTVKGVVHRDFKPGNIFLSDKSNHPVAMVADFGMAKAFEAAGISRNTKTGNVMGTPVFMPRQQALDFKYARPEVDVWAAAASYYNMLTGQFPKNFRNGKNPWQTIVSEEAVKIRKRNNAIPSGLAAVIDRALVEKPEIGYKSAAEFRRDIICALPPEIKEYCKGVIG